MDKTKILVVDDELDICSILKYNLEKEGFGVDTAESAEAALAIDLSEYSLLMLDVMMDGMSGFELASLIRSRKEISHLPIIFVTAKDTEDDTVSGFNLGADDYITKPFSVKEVLSRVKAVLRRSLPPASSASIVRYDTLVLDKDLKTIFVDNEPVMLTKTEFDILALLISNPDKVYSREDILGMVWREDVLVVDRVVDVNITRLRKKIGRYGKNIVTRHGYGYCFMK